MNELIFLLHIVIVLAGVLGALYLGSRALTACIVLQAVLANLFVLKQINLFGMAVTASDVFAVGGILGLNLLQEYYGTRVVRTAIWSSFGLSVWVVLLCQFHVWYAPNIFDTTHTHFSTILAFMPRIMTASLATYLVVQLIDSRMFALLKRLTRGKYLTARTTFSLLSAQLLDTVLFSFLGLYGVLGALYQEILVAYVIKVIIIACSSPFIVLSKRLFTHKSPESLKRRVQAKRAHPHINMTSKRVGGGHGKISL